MRLRVRSVAAIAAAFAWTLASASANAAVTTSGCVNLNLSCNLQELSTGGSIAIDGTVFGNWLIDDASSMVVDLSRIVVLPLNDQATNPGLRFDANGQWTTVGFDLIDLNIRFTVSALNGMATNGDSSLEIDQTSFDAGNEGGFTQITERVLAANGTDILAELLAFVDNAFGNAQETDAAVFGPQSILVVETNLLVNGDSSTDVAALERFSQRFSQVAQIPEPPMLAALALGMAALTMRRQRRRT